MRHRWAVALLLAAMASVVTAFPAAVAPARAADPYALQSRATYDIRPDDGEIVVRVDLTFENTTPDPEGRFSVFSELKVAIHDSATDVAASDEDGALDVSVEVENEVNVATVELRDDVRFEERVSLELTYVLPDGDSPHLRVRPSAVVFPAWGFGTDGLVLVTFPAGYELRVDGDPLREAGNRLTSGPIENPDEWLSLVTAVRPAEYTEFETTVPLDGGTADLVVRAFADDEAWGERTLALIADALPAIEAELGLPYPRLGQLVLTEAVSADTSGFAEGGTGGGTEITVAFDQPAFTALHQVVHVWVSSALIESRWIREGISTEIASRVAQDLEVDPPFDPAAEVEDQADAAFPLDTWAAGATPPEEAFGYAASWDVINELEAMVGADGIQTVLGRVASSMGPYETGEVDPEPAADPSGEPIEPITSRSFLDHLDTVTDSDVSTIFAERVLTESDVALLDARADARAAFDDLAEAAAGWAAPDPVRGALVAWSFDDAIARIEEAREWLEERDALLEDMQEAGLSAPDRLQQAYRAYGGGAEAVGELQAERSVVDAYIATADATNAERSFIERIGLIGGPDPHAQLNMASGLFADGDLQGSHDAILEAERIVAAAETGGVVRIASIVLVVLILLVAAVVIFRRRAAYSAPA